MQLSSVAYEGTGERKGHRNGSATRKLKTGRRITLTEGTSNSGVSLQDCCL